MQHAVIAAAILASTLSTAALAGAPFACDFEGSICGATEQSKLAPEGARASFTPRARTGALAIMLTTQPGDRDVNGSGEWERNDLSFGANPDYCQPGQEEWWAHSVLFPDEYAFPESGGAIVMDFHHQASGGLANFELQVMPQPVGLRLRGHGGPMLNEGQYEAVLSLAARNVWHDFVYHVKWSAGADGFMDAWLNGRRVLAHRGPTLYEGISCYFKLANYRSPDGRASSVIHDRVLRGASAAEVSLTPLEGVP